MPAIEKLAAMITINTALPYGVDRRHFKNAAKAILAAFQASPLEFVKPKPLEWAKTSYGNPECKTIIGTYRINSATNGGYAVVIGYRVLRTVEGLSNYPTLEAAQAAAETHRNEMLKKEFAG